MPVLTDEQIKRMSVRNALIEAIESLGPPPKIMIGTEAWSALKDDPEAIHDISLVDDKLFFLGVEIDPFADIAPSDWKVIHE
jgi:hypothetical protein